MKIINFKVIDKKEVPNYDEYYPDLVETTFQFQVKETGEICESTSYFSAASNMIRFGIFYVIYKTGKNGLRLLEGEIREQIKILVLNQEEHRLRNLTKPYRIE